MFLRQGLSLETSYGSLTLFTTILHNVFLLYHVDTFVSVYKIDKVSFWFGEAIFLAWNSFNDPLFGWFSDSKFLSSKKDQRPTKNDSSDIIWTRLTALHTYGPLFAISFSLFWINWSWPGLQFAVCLCLYDGFLTMIDLHHNALLADLSISGDKRTRLNSSCSVFSAFGSVSVFLSYLFWNKASLSIFRTFCFGLALMSFAGYLVMVKALKSTYTKQSKDSFSEIEVSHKHKDDSSMETQASVVKFGKQLLSHRNFLWFALMNLVQVFHCHFNSNFFPLFLDTLLGEAVSPTVASTLLGLSFVAPHINNLYFLVLCRKFGVYTIIRSLFLVKLGLSLVMYLAGPSWIWLLCLFIASNRVFTEGTCKLLSLVISDLVDEDVVLHSRPKAVSALVFGTAALVSKPGQTLAPVIGTWILALQTGHDIFQSGNESGSLKLDLTKMDDGVQAMYKTGVFSMLICVPVICAVLQLLAWSQFTLRGNRLAQVKAARLGLQQIQV
ncbi:transmembrane protein 180 [Aplysia californica]|uniref:Transmembrane protein 180 n=1 Tax=Aplysia californica TaxID=6500 RepID=A0ABM0JW12_APLCA|nr:transmembrane protein 180 [Aplysia californica]